MEQPDQLLSVGAQLEDLGLDEATLLDAIQYGHGQAALCTAHHPRNAPGLVAWMDSLRRLRDLLVPRGWVAVYSRGWETVVSPDGTMAITVAAGDAVTGRAGTPRTKSNKGPLTREALDRNQMSLADISSVFAALEPAPAPRTWVLLHHPDRKIEEIRAEFSLPAEMDKDGYIIGWSRRLRLTPIKVGYPLPEDDGPEPEETDVPVALRV